MQVSQATAAASVAAIVAVYGWIDHLGFTQSHPNDLSAGAVRVGPVPPNCFI
jgi:hypothetical protein